MNWAGDIKPVEDWASFHVRLNHGLILAEEVFLGWPVSLFHFVQFMNHLHVFPAIVNILWPFTPWNESPQKSPSRGSRLFLYGADACKVSVLYISLCISGSQSWRHSCRFCCNWFRVSLGIRAALGSMDILNICILPVHEHGRSFLKRLKMELLHDPSILLTVEGNEVSK